MVDNATVIEMFLIYEVILKSLRWHSILHSLLMNLQMRGKFEEEMLSIILNSLHLLCKGEKALCK